MYIYEWMAYVRVPNVLVAQMYSKLLSIVLFALFWLFAFLGLICSYRNVSCGMPDWIYDIVWNMWFSGTTRRRRIQQWQIHQKLEEYKKIQKYRVMWVQANVTARKANNVKLIYGSSMFFLLVMKMPIHSCFCFISAFHRIFSRH